jgi:glycosyltransferase involved in cell wall biosynthesis
MISILNLWPIHPPISGGQQAIYGLYGALNKITPCQYIYIDDQQSADCVSTVLANGLPSISVSARESRGASSRMLVPGALYGNPYIKQGLRCGMSRQVRARLAQQTNSSDVIILSHPWLWPAIKFAASNKTIVYDAHNVEYRLSMAPPFRTRMDLLSKTAIRSVEMDLLKQSDLILCCSDVDAADFIHSLGAEASKVRVGFKGTGPKPQISISKENNQLARTCIFVGSKWPPNNEAAHYIAKTLAQQLPQIKFQIAGGCCESLRDSNIPKNVELLGFIEDIDEKIQSADIALNPTTQGSGINIKVLDYLANGTPVVSTAFGLRGIPCTDKPFIATAERPDFPSEITRLISTLTTQTRIATQEWAQSTFGWNRISITLADEIRLRQEARTQKEIQTKSKPPINARQE